MDRGGVGADADRGHGEWLRAYGRVEAILPRAEALAAGRARLEAVNALQHEFWEARDVLLQAGESRRRWEAAYMALQPSGDDRRFPELQNNDLEDLQTFVELLDAENTELKVQMKEVEGGAEYCQNAVDHEHIAGDLKAALRQLKQAYEALCSEKDKEVSALIAEKDKEISALISEKNKEVSALIAEKDFVREQFRTLERNYADLRSYSNKQAAQATEAKQELEQLQVASQKKDDDIRGLRARAKAKAAEAKRKLVPEGKAQEMSCMSKETDGEIEKRRDRQPETCQKTKKVMSETHNKNCSEGPALRRGETKYSSSKQMLAKDGQPQTSQKRKSATFLSNDNEQNANDEETSSQVLEPLKKKREVEQDDSKAKLANSKSNGDLVRQFPIGEVEAKRNSVPEDNLQEMYCMPKETDGEIEKCKGRQPETSPKSKKVMGETHNKFCSEGPALRGEQTKNHSSKPMLAKDGQPQTSQKRKCVTFLSNDNNDQNENDEETSNQVLELLMKKRVPGKGEVEQDDSEAKLANGESNCNRLAQLWSVNDALLYIRAVKDSFSDKPDKFEEFKVLLCGINNNNNRIDAREGPVRRAPQTHPSVQYVHDIVVQYQTEVGKDDGAGLMTCGHRFMQGDKCEPFDEVYCGCSSYGILVFGRCILPLAPGSFWSVCTVTDSACARSMSHEKWCV